MKVKNAIKKVGAAVGSAALVGTTLGAAASLGDFPGMFLDDEGTLSETQIVVGSQVGEADVQGVVSDVVAATNVAASLGQATVQTEEKTQQVSVEGQPGFSADNGATLDTVNKKLLLGDSINDAKATLTDDDLDVLAEGTVSTDNEDYKYQQFIDVAAESPGIATGDGDDELDDADLIMQVPESSELYTAKVSFSTPLNASEAAEDSSEITLFGKDYQIDSYDQSASELVLFGSADTLPLNKGESETFTSADDSEHTVENVAVTGSDVVAVEVDGELKQYNSGDTFKKGGTEVKVDEIIQTNSQTSEGLVKFAIGSEKVTLTDGEEVVQDDEDVDNAVASITQGSNDGEVTEIGISVGAPNDDIDDLQAGDQFEDTVFGTFSFAFGGTTPELDADSKSEIQVGTSSEYADVTLTSASGDEKTITFASEDSGAFTVEDQDGNSYALVEGTELTEGDYQIVDQGDFEHLLQVDTIDIEGSTDDEVVLVDAISGAEYTVSGNMESGSQTLYIDGQEYQVEDSDKDDEITLNSADSKTNVFGTLEDENGAKLALTNNAQNAKTAVDVGTGTATTVDVKLPTGSLTVSVEADDSGSIVTDGISVTGDGSLTKSAAGTYAVDVGQVQYGLNVAVNNSGGTNSEYDVEEVSFSITDQSLSNGDDASANLISKPAIMVVEEQDEQNNENAVVVPVADGGDSDDAMDIASPTFTGYSENGDLDNDDKIYLDVFGTYAEADADDNEFVDLYYPDNQAIVGAGFVGEDGSIEAGATSSDESVTYTAVKNPDIIGSLTDNLGVVDAEADSVKDSNNLVLVGGPAVNSLVQELASENKTRTLEEWRSGDYDGEFLLQTVDNAFSEGYNAMIVAGHAAEDTKAAAKYIGNYKSHADELEGKNKLEKGTTSVMN